MGRPATRRIAPGVYETPEGYRIQIGYSEGVRTGGPVPNGWDVIDPDGEWCERYWTKADALAAAQESARRGREARARELMLAVEKDPGYPLGGPL